MIDRFERVNGVFEPKSAFLARGTPCSTVYASNDASHLQLIKYSQDNNKGIKS